MKKFLLSTFFICLFVALNAAEYTYVIIDEGTNAPSFTTQDGRFSFKASKGEGITGPQMGAEKNGSKDVRCYADNTLVISNLTGENITKIVFGISQTGAYALAEVTPSTGKMADEPEYLAPNGYKEWQYSWTGNASSITFTVGHNCKYGVDCTENEKENVYGTLMFKQITIITDGATAVQQVFDNNIIYASNGTIFGLPSDAQIFSITGQNITNQNGHLRNGIYVVRCSGHTQKIIVK